MIPLSRSVILVTKWFGTFLVQDKRVVTQILFPRTESEIADRLLQIQKGRVLEEERVLAAKKKVSVLETRLISLGKLTVSDTSFVVPAKYSYDDNLLRSALLILAEKRAKEELGADRHISEAISSFDELKEIVNSLDVRLHSWYGLHYPELFDRLKGTAYLDALSKYGDREALQNAKGFSERSIGINLIEGEKEMLMSVASLALEIDSTAEKLGSFVDHTAAMAFPNLTALLGPKLASRIVRGAGGLERLSSMPAGTIQLIGAEKALFRHLNRGKKPPKHGIIFQDILVHSSPREVRGRISRTLAAKAAIAARLDMYGGEMMGDAMRREVEEKAHRLVESSRAHGSK